MALGLERVAALILALAQIDLDHVQAVILTIPAAAAKLIATQLLRQNGYAGSIRALVRQGEGTQALHEAGISSVTLPLTEAGRSLAAISLENEGDGGSG